MCYHHPKGAAGFALTPSTVLTHPGCPFFFLPSELFRIVFKELFQEDLDWMNEHSEQTTIVSWARRWEHLYPELRLLFAIPNGAALSGHTDRRSRRVRPQASKLKAEGLRPGVPDLCLPVRRQGSHGMLIDLKVGKNKPTKEQ